jgi:hypothetical protein
MFSNRDNQKLSTPGSGNASNPSPRNKDLEPATNNQLLDEKAEKYLRESANIEDEPDAQDQQEADEIFKQNKT